MDTKRPDNAALLASLLLAMQGRNKKLAAAELPPDGKAEAFSALLKEPPKK